MFSPHCAVCREYIGMGDDGDAEIGRDTMPRWIMDYDIGEPALFVTFCNE